MRILFLFFWVSTASALSPIETATLGGGCFWGMENLLKKLPGVVSTEVGYMGGTLPSPKYEQVKTGTTSYAESVRIRFHPETLTYENLLLYFFKIHDPTTMNRQGGDVGTQYRSVIFYENEKQKMTAEKTIKRVNDSNAWKGPVVTKLEKATKFWRAEDFHQDYLGKNPGGYTCHFERKLKF